MQMSVKFELAKLRQACRLDKNVNFIAFLNSKYLIDNSFIVCKNQRIDEKKFSQFKNFYSKIAQKYKNLKHKSGLKKLEFKIKELKSIGGAFQNYPLAHPDFLYELINFTITEKSLFPSDEYAAFLHLKSHGSGENILSGMQLCQSRAKILSSEAILKKLLTKDELLTLSHLSSVERIEQNLEIYDRILSKLDLGSSKGLGNFGNDPKLGATRLTSNNIIFGSAVSGLGVGDGLGAGFSFGTNQEHLTQILERLYKTESDRSLGFLMLESCESNRNPSIFHTNLSNIFGYYTAIKSLWYRNLNWWEILKRSKGKTENLVEILQSETSMIPNIEMIQFPN